MRHLLLFVFFLCSAVASFAQPRKETVDRVIGVVGDEVILYSDLKAQELETTEGRESFSQAERCEALEGLLYQKLLLHRARIDSVEVTDVEINQQVEQRLNYYVQMFGTVEQFESYYGKTVAQMKDEYKDLIKDQLMVQKEQQELTKNVKVTPADVQKFYEAIPKDSLPLIEEQLVYSQIMFDPQIRESERMRVISFLDSVRKDIISGRTSMSIQAAKWSEDPGSKYKGGCYPLQRKGSFVPEYETAVASTSEGAYSPVFKSVYGYHFVKVIEKRGEYYESCHILVAPKMVTLDLQYVKSRADSVYNVLTIDSLSFEKAALRFSTDEDSRNQGGQVVNQSTLGTRHPVSGIAPETMLVLRDLKPGQLSQPVLVTKADGNQAYSIYKMVARVNAHRATLDDDYEIFKSEAEAQAKQKEADKWVRKYIAKTFVQVNEEYVTCPLQFPWIKNKP
jgi:peptidyl-prolyl cis-trans isomerase SurA